MQFINLHTHRFTNNPKVLEVTNQYPLEFDATIPKYSIGIHPWHIKKENVEKELNIIHEKLQLNECLALGECGLDKRIEIDFGFQEEVFKQQIELVQNINKPIILHCVSAYDEVIRIKKEMEIKNPMIIHGFSKNWPIAEMLLKNGFYISFGKYLLRNPELESVFVKVPNDKFLLETDMIEENIEEVYTFAAKFKKNSIEDIKEQVWKNFNQIVRL
jgi:TatD DNase family protein